MFPQTVFCSLSWQCEISGYFCADVWAKQKSCCLHTDRCHHILHSSPIPWSVPPPLPLPLLQADPVIQASTTQTHLCVLWDGHWLRSSGKSPHLPWSNTRSDLSVGHVRVSWISALLIRGPRAAYDSHPFPDTLPQCEKKLILASHSSPRSSSDGWHVPAMYVMVLYA